MSLFSNHPAVSRDEYTVQHASLSQYPSVYVRPDYFKPNSRAWRKRTRVVQNPRRIFWRKDGKVTVTGANKANTVTFDPAGMILVCTTDAGSTHVLNL